MRIPWYIWTEDFSVCQQAESRLRCVHKSEREREREGERALYAYRGYGRVRIWVYAVTDRQWDGVFEVVLNMLQTLLKFPFEMHTISRHLKLVERARRGAWIATVRHFSKRLLINSHQVQGFQGFAEHLHTWARMRKRQRESGRVRERERAWRWLTPYWNSLRRRRHRPCRRHRINMASKIFIA